MGACFHIAGVTCENCRQPALWQYPLTQPVCQHCYCQAGPQINGVPHLACCKCGERCAVFQASVWRPAQPPSWLPVTGSTTAPVPAI